MHVNSASVRTFLPIPALGYLHPAIYSLLLQKGLRFWASNLPQFPWIYLFSQKKTTSRSISLRVYKLGTFPKPVLTTKDDR